jgi:hypothetical protein
VCELEIWKMNAKIKNQNCEAGVYSKI